MLIAVVALVLVVRDEDGGGGGDAAPFVPGDQPATTATTWSAPGPEPQADSGDPQQQAAAVDAVLSESVTSRRKLNDAIQRISGCTDLDNAVTDMQDVGSERHSQIETVQQADLSALPGGEDLRSGLVTALTYALEADQGFLGWAEPAEASGCASTSSRAQAYAKGREASDQAGAAKRRFLVIWNPVALDNGLSTRSANDI